MTPIHWFLPQSVDVLGMLGEQAAITVDGIAAQVAWAGGEDAAADRLRELEHRADKRKRELREALTEAFSTPLEPEDIFELSRGLDEILNSAKNIVGGAEAMQTAPDAAIAKMAAELADGTRLLAEACALIGRGDRAGATAVADRAVKYERKLEHTYRAAMSALIEVEDPRELAARRELYSRLARTGVQLARWRGGSGTRS